ncbi:MAG: hypothetical protein LBF57_00840 [Holosporaceae bacterium]|jgi:uncharacterized protein YjfI (DUF2170 family)|nr:hypothetical protein [Holosporaceae bacterium]
MYPWDFGIINAIRKELQCAIFPANPPEELRKTPYLIFELKNILQGKNLLSRAEFSITIVDNEEKFGFIVLRSINKIISRELTLSQGEAVIGSAKAKINSVESKGNSLILNMVAILKLEAIYEDEE